MTKNITGSGLRSSTSGKKTRQPNQIESKPVESLQSTSEFSAGLAAGLAVAKSVSGDSKIRIFSAVPGVKLKAKISFVDDWMFILINDANK